MDFKRNSYEQALELYSAGKDFIKDSEFTVLEESIAPEYRHHYTNSVTEGMYSVNTREKLSIIDYSVPKRLTYKMDGFNIGLSYINGFLSKVLTRGSINRKEITNMVTRMFPNRINTDKPHIYIAGELTIKNDCWQDYKKKKLLKSQRNAVASAVADEDIEVLQYYAFAIYEDDKKRTDIYNVYQQLHNWGFNTPPTSIVYNEQQLLESLTIYATHLPQFNFPTDGIVVEDDKGFQCAVRLGYWEEDCKVGIIEGFDEQYGIHNAVPIAIIKPVEFADKTITKVSLYNPEMIRSLNLQVGTMIAIDFRSFATPVINKKVTAMINNIEVY